VLALLLELRYLRLQSLRLAPELLLVLLLESESELESESVLEWVLKLVE
jgi:hypothetical protein